MGRGWGTLKRGRHHTSRSRNTRSMNALFRCFGGLNARSKLRFEREMESTSSFGGRREVAPFRDATFEPRSAKCPDSTRASTLPYLLGRHRRRRDGEREGRKEQRGGEAAGPPQEAGAARTRRHRDSFYFLPRRPSTVGCATVPFRCSRRSSDAAPGAAAAALLLLVPLFHERALHDIAALTPAKSAPSRGPTQRK